MAGWTEEADNGKGGDSTSSAKATVRRNQEEGEAKSAGGHDAIGWLIGQMEGKPCPLHCTSRLISSSKTWSIKCPESTCFSSASPNLSPS